MEEFYSDKLACIEIKYKKRLIIIYQEIFQNDLFSISLEDKQTGL